MRRNTDRPRERADAKQICARAWIALEALLIAALFGVPFLCAYAPLRAVWAVLIALALCAGIAPLEARRRAGKRDGGPIADGDALARAYDKSAKRLINCAFLLAALAARGLSVVMRYAYIRGGSFSAEGAFFSEGAYFCAALCALVFCAARHAFLRAAYAKQLKDARVGAYRKHFLWVCAFSAAYWGAGFIAMDFMRWTGAYQFTWLLLLFFAAWAAYAFALRKRIAFVNFRFNARRVAVAALLVGAVLTEQMLTVSDYSLLPYICVVRAVPGEAREIAYDSQTGVYALTAGDAPFKVLQLTDIHLGGSRFSSEKDIKALSAVDALLRATEPDLVIVTGDLVYPVAISSFSLSSIAPATQFAAYMRNTGVPWAFAYGNHDTERMGRVSADNFDGMLRSLSWRTSKNLLYPYVQPDIFGRNNQLIKILNPDGTLRQALFLLDSNAYAPGSAGFGDYDFIRDDQVDWYASTVRALNEEAGRTVPSMLFFHIPIREYALARDAWRAGDAESEYFYGRADTPVSASAHASRLFDAALELGSTKAMFCGHDHYNNLSVEYRGIRLTYGMSIDYLAEPGIENETAQRGATLIEIAPDGSFSIAPVPLSGVG